ncbi:WD-REPEATS-REGION domain-containing protein [Mycena kentingensis (nom. inval.)]|nr:WD-REPEATS-REGION domain-containing protein [Mycena kentingensis (nom. inval.)]
MEDRQPNESLRPKSGPSLIQSTRPDTRPDNYTRPHSHPHSRPHSRHTRPNAPKRPADNTYPLSPSKRRKLNPPRTIQELVPRQLPQNCRKGAYGSHSSRRSFIASEAERLQAERPGLRVLQHATTDTQVIFTCDVARETIPAPPADTTERAIQNSPELQTRRTPSPSPPLRSAQPIGPFRSFKSGTLSFRVPLKCNGEPEARTSAPPVTISTSSFGEQHTQRRSPGASERASTSVGASASEPALSVSPAPSRPPRSVSRELPPIATLEVEPDSDDDKLPDASEFALANLSRSRRSPDPELMFILDGEDLRLPSRQQHDKLRRLLCDPDGSVPRSFTVSMQGFLEGVDLDGRTHYNIQQDTDATRRASVEDACIVANGERTVAILAHGRESQQLSLLDCQEIRRNGVVTFADLHRPWNTAKKGGVSSVAAMHQPASFASGGHDHAVHLWTLEEEDFVSATPQLLHMKHTAVVQSLLGVFDTTRKVMSAGADCSVHLWDLSSERVVHSLKTSNSVYHVHSTSSPFRTLFELAHREFQFEVHDHRLVPSVPTLRFGYANPQLHGRFAKGASFSDYFASGDRDGVVRIWDLRRADEPCCEIECLKGQKVAHIIAEASRLVVCSETYQIGGAIHGAAIGLGSVIIAHYTWPFFRRQTLSGKLFLVCASSVFGLVISAENALQQYEAFRRVEENSIRKQARFELGQRGIVPTESAIAQWRQERDN